MKSLAAFLCSLALVSVTTAHAAVLPWTTFSGPMVQAVIGQPMLQSCGRDQEIFVAAFKHGDTAFLMVFAQSNGNLIFFYDTKPEDPNAPPVEIGFARMDPNKHDTIPPIRWVTYNREIHNDICGLMFPREA